VVGQTFSLAIKTNVSSSQQVGMVDAYINFDPDKLEVLSVTPGTSLPTVLQNTFNNTTGLISYVAGQLGFPWPIGNFTVATIQFRAKTVISNVTTPVTVSITGDHIISMVVYGGTIIPGTHGDASVQITPDAVVNFSLVLQGGSRPDSGWVVPLTVKFFTPGVDVLTATPVYSFDLTTSKNGAAAIAQAAVIAPGTYDITANSTTTLTNIKRTVSIAAPTTDVNMGTLLEGNANGNNVINIQDFGILAAAYGKSAGVAGFNPLADFDRNGVVNITDFGLLAVNYGKYCPVEVATSKQYSTPPKMTIDINKKYTATMHTTKGDIVIELLASEAPVTVNNFIFLARDGFYNSVKFHRVIKGFMIQSGDPKGDGTGGPGYKFDDEPVTRQYLAGTMAMANAGPNTNGSRRAIPYLAWSRME
jgi:hypothetical protein